MTYHLFEACLAICLTIFGIMAAIFIALHGIANKAVETKIDANHERIAKLKEHIDSEIKHINTIVNTIVNDNIIRYCNEHKDRITEKSSIMIHDGIAIVELCRLDLFQCAAAGLSNTSDSGMGDFGLALAKQATSLQKIMSYGSAVTVFNGLCALRAILDGFGDKPKPKSVYNLLVYLHKNHKLGDPHNLEQANMICAEHFGCSLGTPKEG